MTHSCYGRYDAAIQLRGTRGVASLIECAIRALDPRASRLHDQGERGHAATAHAAKKVLFPPTHSRNLRALPRRCKRYWALQISKKRKIAVVMPGSRVDGYCYWASEGKLRRAHDRCRLPQANRFMVTRSQ